MIEARHLTRRYGKLATIEDVSSVIRQEYGFEKPMRTITLSRKTSDTLTYLLGKNPKNDDYTLKASNRPEYFRLPSYRATALLEAADRKQLLTTAPETHAHTSS